MFFQCMSPTRSEYSKLGLKLVSLEDNCSRTPKKPSMVEEKKNDGADDPINLLLEQALTRQRDEMMENFSHILQRLPIASGASSSSGHFGGTSPFKVQVNFDIPVFEGQIDAEALEKWLTLLEGYFSVHNFSDKEKITFTLLKSLPHVKHWWETYWEQSSTEESGIYGADPTGDFFVDAVKEQYYPVGNYEDQYMRWTTLWQERGQAVLEFTNTFHTLRTKLGIKDSERHLVLKYRGALHRYIQTEMDFLDISSLGAAYRYAVKIEQKFKHQNKWEFGSANRNNQSMTKTTLTNSLLKTSPRHRKGRVTGRQRRKLENGAISTKSPGTTPTNVAQNSHWWLRSKTRSQTLIQNLILKIMVKDRSSTQTPLLLSRPQQFNQKNQQILKRGSTFFIHRCG
jgi:hypothetical protein